MTRRDQEWLTDIEVAIEAISDYVANGDLHEGVVYDACRARLMEIAEAVKHVDSDLLCVFRSFRTLSPEFSYTP